MPRHSVLPYVLAVLFASLALGHNHRATADDVEAPVTIAGAVRFDMTSRAGLDYRIFVLKPNTPAPEQGYPIIYLTDGNANFPLMVAAIERQPALRNALVVGIGYPTDERAVHFRRRTYDLLFPVDEDWLATQPSQFRRNIGETAGGADAFLEFITGELKPRIEQRFRIDRTRQLLFGHSFGGLFVLYALFQRPGEFQMYCASSPSIWVNDRSVLKQVDAFVAKLDGIEEPLQVQISAGEREAPGHGAPPEREALLASRRQVGNARELADRLATASARLNVTFEVFPKEDHGSAILPAASRAAAMLSGH